MGLSFEEARTQVSKTLQDVLSEDKLRDEEYTNSQPLLYKFVLPPTIIILLTSIVAVLFSSSYFIPGVIAALLFFGFFVVLNTALLYKFNNASNYEIRSDLSKICADFQKDCDECSNTADDLPSMDALIHAGHSHVSIITCYRDNQWQRIPSLLLAEGDVIALQAGDISPGRCVELPSKQHHSVDTRAKSTTEGVIIEKGTTILLRDRSTISPPKSLSAKSAASSAVPGTSSPPPSFSYARHKSLPPESVELLQLSGDVRCFRMKETPIGDFVRTVLHKHRSRQLMGTVEGFGTKRNTGPNSQCQKDKQSIIRILFLEALSRGMHCLVVVVALIVIIGVIRLYLGLGSINQILHTIIFPCIAMILSLTPLPAPLYLLVGESIITANFLATSESILWGEAEEQKIKAKTATLKVGNLPMGSGGASDGERSHTHSAATSSVDPDEISEDEFNDDDIDERTLEIAEEARTRVHWGRRLQYLLAVIKKRIGWDLSAALETAQQHPSLTASLEILQVQHPQMSGESLNSLNSMSEKGSPERTGSTLRMPSQPSLLPVPHCNGRLLEYLGAVTRVCFVDDDVICEGFSVTEEIFLLRARDKDDIMLQTEGGKGTVLDLHANSDAHGSRFEDPTWWKFLPNLKPIGLSAMLTHSSMTPMTPIPRGNGHAKASDDILSTADLLLGRAKPKAVPPKAERDDLHVSLVSHVRKAIPSESLRELAEEIGFTENDANLFKKLLEMNVIAPGLGDAKLLEDTHAWGQEETRRRGTLMTQIRGAVVRDSRSGALQLLTHGVPALVLHYCGQYWDGTSITPFTPADRKEVLAVYDRWELEDFDVVGFGYTPIPTYLTPAVLQAHDNSQQKSTSISSPKSRKPQSKGQSNCVYIVDPYREEDLHMYRDHASHRRPSDLVVSSTDDTHPSTAPYEDVEGVKRERSTDSQERHGQKGELSPLFVDKQRSSPTTSLISPRKDVPTKDEENASNLTLSKDASNLSLLSDFVSEASKESGSVSSKPLGAMKPSKSADDIPQLHPDESSLSLAYSDNESEVSTLFQQTPKREVTFLPRSFSETQITRSPDTPPIRFTSQDQIEPITPKRRFSEGDSSPLREAGVSEFNRRDSMRSRRAFSEQSADSARANFLHEMDDIDADLAEADIIQEVFEDHELDEDGDHENAGDRRYRDREDPLTSRSDTDVDLQGYRSDRKGVRPAAQSAGNSPAKSPQTVSNATYALSFDEDEMKLHDHSDTESLKSKYSREDSPEGRDRSSSREDQAFHTKSMHDEAKIAAASKPDVTFAVEDRVSLKEEASSGSRQPHQSSSNAASTHFAPIQDDIRSPKSILTKSKSMGVLKSLHGLQDDSLEDMDDRDGPPGSAVSAALSKHPRERLKHLQKAHGRLGGPKTRKPKGRSVGASLWPCMRQQVFLGMAASSVPVKAEVTDLHEELTKAGIRFVYFSPRNMRRSKPVAEKIGITFDWNCAISLRDLDEDLEYDPHRAISKYGDWDVNARLPHGVEAIKAHIQDVDNVPLLVSLYTDSTPDTIKQMVEVFQENGEVVMTVGSAYREHNQHIFDASDVALAVGMLPGDTADIAADLHDVLERFPLAHKTALTRGELLLHFRLCGLGSIGMLQTSFSNTERPSGSGSGTNIFISTAESESTDPVDPNKSDTTFSINDLIPDATLHYKPEMRLSVLLEGVRMGRIYLLNAMQSVAVLYVLYFGMGAYQVLAAMMPMSVPPVLSPFTATLFAFLYFPIMTVGVVNSSAPQLVMKNTPRKNIHQRRDEKRFAMYLLIRASCVALSTALFAWIATASVLGDKTLRMLTRLWKYYDVLNTVESTSTIQPYLNEYWFVQDLVSILLLLASIAQVATLLERGQKFGRLPTPMSQPYFWVATSTVVYMHAVVVAWRTFSRKSALAKMQLNMYYDLPWIVWACFVLLPMIGIAVGLLVNMHDDHRHRRFLQFLRLEFDTRLGMHSPR